MTHKENLAEKEVTTTQLASIIGLTARRIRQLSQDGVLVSSSPGKYILSDAVQAYIGSLARGGMAKEEAEEAKELSGQMHRSEDVAAMTAELIYTIRGALMALPSRVAINAAALSDPAEVAEYMRGEVNQIAEEIATFRYDPAKYEACVRERRAWDEKLTNDDE